MIARGGLTKGNGKTSSIHSEEQESGGGVDPTSFSATLKGKRRKFLWLGERGKGNVLYLKEA